MRKLLASILAIVGLVTFAACSLPKFGESDSNSSSENLQTSETSSKDLLSSEEEKEENSSSEEVKEEETSSEKEQDSQSSQDKNQIVEPIVGGGTFDVGDKYNG